MSNIVQISEQRRSGWTGVPKAPGVYRWFFPPRALERLRIVEFANVENLRLRCAPNGYLCLYNGMANDLRERLQWHAEQKLTSSALSSGFLSTFRFTLLALNDLEFKSGDCEINEYFDDLLLEWKEAASREDAMQMERVEFDSGFHFPLNIQGNRSSELRPFLHHLKGERRSYKTRNLENLHG